MSNLTTTIDSAARDAAFLGHRLDRIVISMPLDGGLHAALALGWSGDTGFEERRYGPTTVSSWSKPATTIREIGRPAEATILACAWRFGSPDIARTQFKPRPAHMDPRAPSSGLPAAFGGQPKYTFGINSDDLVLDINDGRTDWMIDVAASHGYLSYHFRPGRGWLCGGESRTDNATIDEDGHRARPMPNWVKPRPIGVADCADAHTHVWEFSKGSRLISYDQWVAKYLRHPVAA
jgi:hypothetical protein